MRVASIPLLNLAIPLSLGCYTLGKYPLFHPQVGLGSGRSPPDVLHDNWRAQPNLPLKPDWERKTPFADIKGVHPA